MFRGNFGILMYLKVYLVSSQDILIHEYTNRVFDQRL